MRQEQDVKEFEVNEFKAEKDAEDFMDEDELIEVADAQDGVGAEAEFEDYDVESEEEIPVKDRERRVLEPARRVEKVTQETQAERVKAVGVKLPILGQSAAGDSILDFSVLFKSMVLDTEENKEGQKIPEKRTVVLKQEQGAALDDEEFLLADRRSLERLGLAEQIVQPKDD